MVFTFYFNTFTGHLQNQQLLKEINQDCKHKIQGSDSRHSGFAIHILYIHRWGSVCLPLRFCNYTSIINTSAFKGHLKWDMRIDSTVPFKCKSNHLRNCSHRSKLCLWWSETSGCRTIPPDAETGSTVTLYSWSCLLRQRQGWPSVLNHSCVHPWCSSTVWLTLVQPQ